MSLVKTKIGEYDLLVESDDNTTPGNICSGRNTVKTQRKNDSFYSEIIKEAKGIKVEVENEKAKIDVNIIVEYGTRIPDVAFEIQNRVKKSVENMTGLKVSEVNVHVQGVKTEREEDKKQENNQEQENAQETNEQ